MGSAMPPSKRKVGETKTRRADPYTLADNSQNFFSLLSLQCFSADSNALATK